MTDIDISPTIEDVDVSALVPAPYNPRQISEGAFAGLRRSLKRFGYVDLLVVNRRTMHVLSGNQRLKAILAAGADRIPVIMVDLSETEEKALNVTMNNPKIAGEWTEAIIPLLEELRKDDPETYIGLKIEALREELAELENANEVVGDRLPDDIPDPPPPRTRPGDIWTLGDHRLMCGSSLNIDDVRLLMAGEKARLFATDPPYCIDYTGADRPGGGKDWSGVYRENLIAEPLSFYRDFYAAAAEITEKNAAHYLWFSDKRRTMIETIWKEAGFLVHQTIIWVKPVSVMTFSFYPWRHEPCLMGWRNGHKPKLVPAQKWAGKVSSVWPITLIRSGDPEDPAYYSDLWELDFDGKKRSAKIGHPTVKPTEVFAIPMRIHTNPGDICYEPFSGSGSQIIAAERTRRRCFAMELEPVFCDIAVRRWEEFTGRKAELERGEESKRGEHSGDCS